MNIFSDMIDDNDNHQYNNDDVNSKDITNRYSPEIGFRLLNMTSAPIASIDDEPDNDMDVITKMDDQISDKTQTHTENENETEKISSSSENKDSNDSVDKNFDTETDNVDANLIKKPLKNDKTFDDRVVDCIYCAFSCCDCSIM